MPEPTPYFIRSKHEFSQDGNTLGTTDEIEQLIIEQETQLPGDEPFFVIRTEGWSFNDAEELVALLRQCQLCK